MEGQGALVQSALDREGYGHRAVAAAFSSEERVLGAIHATFEPPSGQAYGELVWAADSFARLAALCMARDVTVAAALGSASFDALTGCLSYAGVMEVLEAEVERSQRRGHRLSCCMIDIDSFKQINDTRGHIEGNRVLAAVGEALRSAARRYDAVGRFGGDEFMIVLPETGGHARRHVAERLRASIRSTVEVTSIPIDTSIGIVEWDGESTPDDLVEAADRAMQEAKAHGGARVEAEPVREGAADGLAELTRHLTRPWGMDPGFDPRGPESGPGDSPPAEPSRLSGSYAAARSCTCAWCSSVSRDRALGLAQRPVARGRRLGERPPERLDHEPVRLGGEREAAARPADDPARGAREAGTARRARRSARTRRARARSRRRARA